MGCFFIVYVFMAGRDFLQNIKGFYVSSFPDPLILKSTNE